MDGHRPLEPLAMDLFLHAFYARCRRDPVLAPIFDNAVEDWDVFLERMTDFWRTAVFEERFNPADVPNRLRFGHTRESLGRLRQVWDEAAESLFDPAGVERLREVAGRVMPVVGGIDDPAHGGG